MILYVHGVIIRAATEARAGQQILHIEPWFNLTFAGSLLATLFWVSQDYYTCKQHTCSTQNCVILQTVVIILWHFNDVGKNDE